MRSPNNFTFKWKIDAVLDPEARASFVNMASNGNNHPSNQLNKDWSAAPGPAGDDRSPRPPKLDTESRVLNIIHKNNDRGNCMVLTNVKI